MRNVVTAFGCHWEGTKNLVCWSRYIVPTLSKSTKEVFILQGAWLSSNRLPTIAHDQAFHIITWQHPHGECSPYLPPGYMLNHCWCSPSMTVIIYYRGLWCLMPFSKIFKFYWWMKLEYLEKTTDLFVSH